MQPENYLEHDLAWASNRLITIYNEQVAQQVPIGFTIDPVERTELVWAILNSVFLEELIIKNRKRAILEIKSGKANLKLW